MHPKSTDFNAKVQSMPITNPGFNDNLAQVELLERPGGASLRLRFNGPFEGSVVTWDATFTTLANGQSPGQVQRNFIEIGDKTPHGIALTVGLNVPCIDIPTVRKAILMIRQYKRLARGRHEFGPAALPVTPEGQE